MDKQETYQEKYNRARARVEEIKAFYNHLFIFIIVNIGLASFNYYQNEWLFIWFLFPLGGWALGLIGHAIATFSSNPFTGKDWEQRKIQEILDQK